MTQQRKKDNSDTEPLADEAKIHALRQYNDTDGHFSLVRFVGDRSRDPPYQARNFHLADLVTIMNGVCGAFSIFSSARYLVTKDPNYLWTALWLPLAGCMFDLFDGKIARWRKASSMLGQELDSLADLISFGVAPGLLAFVVGLRTWLDTVILTGFICCGLARLARFNATVALIPKDTTGKSNYIEGLPIPSSLVLVGMLFHWQWMGWTVDTQGIPLGQVTVLGNPGGDGDVHVVSFIFAAWAAAMVSKTLRVPKP